ncbi:hypothetical protein C5167_024791 [Papaver somniferum]|uniref:Uncharacterized protein n=1 Tax=Papaver somniferum TaxID=3469 RepID=A0A4Y7JSW4_PAPSO|nr:hypothetical protein C5167_024791 [Papaver somniferum]
MDDLPTSSIIIIINNYNLYQHNDLSSQYFHFHKESKHRLFICWLVLCLL